MMPTEPSLGASSLAQWLRAFRGPWSRTRSLQALAVGILCCLAGAVVGHSMRMQGVVLAGVVLDGRNVAGYPRDRLTAELRQRGQALRDESLRIRVGDNVFVLSLDRINAELQVDSAVEQAMAAGRELPLWRRWRFAIGMAPVTAPVHAAILVDEALWERELAAFEGEALEVPSEGAVRYAEGRIVVDQPRPGTAIERVEALLALEKALLTGERVLTLPLTHVEPKTTVAGLLAARRKAQTLVSGSIVLMPVLPLLAADAQAADPTGPPPPPAKEVAPAVPNGQDPAPATPPEVSLTREQLGQALRSEVDNGRPGQLRVYLEASALEPVLGELRERWTRPAVDARFVVGARDQITIEPHQQATVLEPTEVVAALWRAAERTPRVAEVPIHWGALPALTQEIAAGLGISKRVSDFTTYHPCCRPRVKNIHRIAELVDGTVVLPGESFSLNTLIGERRARTGFVPAPTIVLGEMRDTVGGGISQFATTIYNAIFDGGYEIIERQPHSYYFSRYPLGHEATVSFPKPDFIFRNDTEAGALLKTRVSGTSVQVVVYGDNGGRKARRRVSKRYDWVEPELEYVANDELLPGKEHVVERGERGFSVDVARLLTLGDGQVVEQERKVIYKPRVRVVEVHSCELPDAHPDRSGDPCPEPASEVVDAGAGR